MPFKHRRSKFYQVEMRDLPGVGWTGRMSTRTTSRRLAERMERCLVHLAERSLLEPVWRDLLDRVIAKEVKLPDLLQASSAGTLEQLLRGLTDPPLAEAVEAWLTEANPGRTVRMGADHLLRLAPETARFSYVCNTASVRTLCLDLEATGLKRNSVRRMLLRAISLLLRHHLGTAERNRILADLNYTAEDDTREVLLEPQQIADLLTACQTLASDTGSPLYHELGLVVQLALATGADRGVLVAGRRAGGTAAGLSWAQLRIYQEDDGTLTGEVYLDDRKAKARQRTVRLGPALCDALVQQAAITNTGPTSQVFQLGYEQMDYHWNKARLRADLPRLRFKDLRSQFAIYGQRAGIAQATLMGAMGHTDMAQTARYARHQATLTPNQATTIESLMGLAPTG